MDKTTIMRAFNNMFTEFLDDVIVIVPENGDIKKTKLYFDTVRSMNPSIVIKLWFSNVYEPYRNQIDAGDIRFFINKEYEQDIHELQNASEVLQAIQKLKQPVREMSEANKAISMTYLQKLSQLSGLYQTLM